MDLTNASAIVTGGAGGFGSATVRRLAQKSAKVVIADVSDERGEALAREVGASRTATIERCRSIMFLGMPERGV
jgi:NAD(P)-dependent dehydrogenase (short-subunit alcohol dehydrogenase family)